MTIRLVDAEWGRELTDGLRADTRSLRIICPFIKAGALERLLSLGPRDVRVITRFNLADFADGVSDIAALRKLLTRGDRVRGIKNLHAKLYLFGTSRAIVTSANLTQAALARNPEFGVVLQDPASIATCANYFDTLWAQGGADLTATQLDAWDEVVTRHNATGRRAGFGAGLGDFGASVGFGEQAFTVMPMAVADAPQAFVKFLGEGSNRAPLAFETVDEIERAGCHWAVAYPAKRRPTGVEDGAVLFIGRLTRQPNDIRIFGRAIGMAHVPRRDDATGEDIELRRWKKKWPRYIRVHHAEFVAGAMTNGVSLNELMDTLGEDSFASTQRNSVRGEGNTDPRGAYRQQAAVELSKAGFAWLSERLQVAFDRYGKVPQDALDKLDWPIVPGIAQQVRGE
jgi:hypothetical protein